MIAEFAPAPFDDRHVPVVDPSQDLDGDDVLDTRIGDGSVLSERLLGGTGGHDIVEFVSDLDGDGYADHVVIVEGDGDYAAWELTSGPGAEWVQTDGGAL